MRPDAPVGAKTSVMWALASLALSAQIVLNLNDLNLNDLNSKDVNLVCASTLTLNVQSVQTG